MLKSFYNPICRVTLLTMCRVTNKVCSESIRFNREKEKKKGRSFDLKGCAKLYKIQYFNSNQQKNYSLKHKNNKVSHNSKYV